MHLSNDVLVLLNVISDTMRQVYRTTTRHVRNLTLKLTIILSLLVFFTPSNANLKSTFYSNPRAKIELIDDGSHTLSHVTQKQKAQIQFCNIPLNQADSILYEMLVREGVHHPDIVIAQARQETGDYKSNLCKRWNNLFGIYDSKKKMYAHFSSYEECVHAYKTRIQYKCRDGEDYWHFLKRIRYASDPNYINAIKRKLREVHLPR